MRQVVALFCVLTLAGPVRSAETDRELGRALRPLLVALDSRVERFTLNLESTARIDGREQRIAVEFARLGATSFALRVTHDRYGFALLREAARTSLYLPGAGRRFLGRGAVSPRDDLKPAGALSRLVSERTLARTLVRWASDLYAASNLKPEWAGRLLVDLAGLEPGTAPGEWKAPGDGLLRFAAGEVVFEFPGARGRLSVRRGAATPDPADYGEGAETVELDRVEMERAISRGFSRALDVLLPAPEVRSALPDAEVPGGRRITVDGQRVVLLAGTPEEIGRAHGQLLAEEAVLCVDSTVYLTGLAYTLDRGRWFLDDLRDAWRRLAPHIPEAHRAEMDALADAIGLDRETVRIANVFPELFHCSGFAVFGSATADGKLYHGRVLDYMTEIGLQDCAAVFVVAPEGKRRFVNVGYAGFVGSVSGMNEAGISLGEMGGRGEGNWDGAPMATLMRRALEECGTLDAVLALWRGSPRTCEYYYVVAEGKIPDAVGVAATPERFEVIRAGEDHPELGPGIPDAVVLSAGGRLTELRRRVTERHGRIDAETGRWLMSRPVAMRSNLHDVLFVPADLVLWVAQAGRDRPAAEMPYARLDVADLIRRLPSR